VAWGNAPSLREREGEEEGEREAAVLSSEGVRASRPGWWARVLAKLYTRAGIHRRFKPESSGEMIFSTGSVSNWR
jgi:hypothetical protein